MEEQLMAEKNLILKVLVGSRLYGTETKESDKDYMGIFIPDKDYTLGMKRCEQVEIRTNPTSSGRKNTPDDTDTVLYSLPKFIKLAAENNPNIIEVFFAPEKNIIFETAMGDMFLQSYPLFISKKVKHTFCGYAHSQRMKLLNKNPIGSRKEIVEKYGYDTKFASHLVRLLSEGIEFLVEGKLSLPLSNNRLLKHIKLGKVDLNYVLRKADEYEQLIDQAYVKSNLQHTPQLDKINKLQIDMLESWYKQQSRTKEYQKRHK